VVLRADSYETQHWTASVGGGLAMLPRFRADAEPSLQRIETPVPIPSAEIRLGVHSENRHVPRVRIVLDCKAEAARARAAILNPIEPIATRA
jgi:DNA-binding transcriptional LysR family regulator